MDIVIGAELPQVRVDKVFFSHENISQVPLGRKLLSVTFPTKLPIEWNQHL